MKKNVSKDNGKKGIQAGGAVNTEKQKDSTVAVLDGRPPTETTAGTPLTETTAGTPLTETTAGMPPEAPLKPDEYKGHLELYKFGLEFSFKAITIYFLLVSGVLTLGLDLSKPSDPTVKRALLITSFLVNIAMILGFGLTTYLWSRLCRKVRGEVNWKTVCDKPRITWNEFAARLYSPSLTMMLAITTLLFIIFSFSLGKIMARYGIWFCEGCYLNFSA